MEIKKASIQRGETQVFLVFRIKDQDIKIALTDDNPGKVKEAFNKLLLELKKGPLKFDLDDPSEDLYHHICVEYLNQLNTEIGSIYKQLSDFELLEVV